MNTLLRSLVVVFLHASLAFSLEPLSFEECLQEAERSNPELSAAKSAFQATVFQARGASFNFFPQVAGSLSLDYGHNANTDGWKFSPFLQAKQNLFSGFSDLARIELAAANRESAEADLNAIKAKISFDLKSAFSGLLYAQELQDLSKNILERREANFKLVSLRFDSGRENLGSKRLADAYLKLAKFENFQANNAILSASISLAKVMGRESSEELRVKGSIPLCTLTTEPDFNLLATKTPDYQKAQAQEKSALSSRKSARSGFFPVIDFSASIGEVKTATASNLHSLLSLSVSMPIFNGGRDYYAWKSASQNWKSAMLTKRKIQTEGTTRLSSAYFAFAEAIERVQVDHTFLDALVTREKIAKAKYDNGLLSFEDWDIIENDYIARQKAVLASQRNLVTAEASWENAKGSGLLP